MSSALQGSALALLPLLLLRPLEKLNADWGLTATGSGIPSTLLSRLFPSPLAATDTVGSVESWQLVVKAGAVTELLSVACTAAAEAAVAASLSKLRAALPDSTRTKCADSEDIATSLLGVVTNMGALVSVAVGTVLSESGVDSASTGTGVGDVCPERVWRTGGGNMSKESPSRSSGAPVLRPDGTLELVRAVLTDTGRLLDELASADCCGDASDILDAMSSFFALLTAEKLNPDEPRDGAGAAG